MRILAAGQEREAPKLSLSLWHDYISLQGLRLSLGRPGQALEPPEADRCRDSGGVRERGGDWAQDRKLPPPEPEKTSLAQPALTRPRSWPEPCLPAHTSQASLLQSPSSHRAPLHQPGLLLFTPFPGNLSDTSISWVYLSLHWAYCTCLEKIRRGEFIHSFSNAY